jgi:hypothetical protein
MLKIKETIFDHNPTADELYKITNFEDTTIKQYQIALTSDCALADLWILFKIRGDKQTAQRYFDKIKSKKYKWKLKFLEAGCLTPGYLQGQ